MPEWGPDPTAEELVGMPPLTHESDNEDDDDTQASKRVLGGMDLPIDEPSPGETLTSSDEGARENRWRKKVKRGRIQRSLRQKIKVQELEEHLKASEAKWEKKWTDCLKQNQKWPALPIPGKEGKLNFLETHEPEGFNNISDDIWELIVMYVDSGATEIVLTEGMLSMMELKESSQSKRGVTYEVANGVRIPNLGEKKVHWAH